jgi:hypothetical protein
MLTASASPSVWSWVAFVGLAFVLALVGYGVIRLNRRRPHRTRRGSGRNTVGGYRIRVPAAASRHAAMSWPEASGAWLS